MTTSWPNGEPALLPTPSAPAIPPPAAPVALGIAALAEFVGTFIFVLIGTAVATAASLGNSSAGAPNAPLSIALSFGLALIAIVGAIGHVSGVHVNPTVTLGLAVARSLPWARVPAYVGAKMAGGILAALVI